MRVINYAKDYLTLVALDEPGPGGAYHEYEIRWTSTERKFGNIENNVLLPFQKGPIKEVGINGITNEVLLAIVIDRLTYFQAGEYACEENSNALELATQALEWLHARTRKRMERGVEGTSQK